MSSFRERYAERKRKKTQEENIQDQAEQAKRQRKLRQQETPERREERRRNVGYYSQIRRTAEEVEVKNAIWWRHFWLHLFTVSAFSHSF